MVVVTQNKGMTVDEVTGLRTKMRAAGATFKVAKNRLAILALDGTRFEGISPMLKGTTALRGRPTRWRWRRLQPSSPGPREARIIGGALGTQTLDADGIKALAELPSLDALRAKLLGCLPPRPRRIAGVLQAPAGQLARVLGAYAKAAGGDGAPEGAPPPEAEAA